MQPIPTDDALFEPVRFKKADDRALTPAFATPGSAGFDLAVLEDTFIPYGDTVMASTGLIIAAPERHMILVAPRSSTWKRWGIRMANTVGIVDSDFCGDEDEMYLALWNAQKARGTSRGTLIPAGTRIAQGIFVPVHTEVAFVQTSKMGDSRGGWGSTGT